MVGDKALDMEFARRAKLRAVLVGSAEPVHGDDFVRAADFAAATQTILACLRGVPSSFRW
jgi:histidinol phosphatase-like enzyme